LNNASTENSKNIQTLKKCINELNTSFLINSKTGDSGLTENVITSLNSFDSSISSVISEIDSQIKLKEKDRDYYYAKANSTTED